MKITQNTFVSNNDPTFNACVGSNGGWPNFSVHGHGFLQASLLLINDHRMSKFMRQPTISLDYIIYPIVYNMRHGIELYLKHFLLILERNNSNGTLSQTNHELDNLWLHIKNHLQKIDENHFTASMKELDNIINDIHTIDPKSFTFRYPTDKKLKPHNHGLSIIDVENLELKIKRLLTVFEDWELAMEYLYDDLGEI